MTIKSILSKPHRTGLRVRNSLSGSSARWGLPLALLAILFAWLALSPVARAFDPKHDESDANENTAEGSNALFHITSGASNTALGYFALFYDTTGSSNTATGNSVLYNNTTGFNNTATGSHALYFNTKGDDNTATGLEALRGHIYWILSNPIYVERLRHKDQIHDGLHAAIVDQEIWDRVQHHLAAQTQPRAVPRRNAEVFLAGRLYDDWANRMSPSHAAKGGRRWRYYVSRALLKGRNSDAGSVPRVSPEQIEKQVFDATKSVIASRRSIDGLGALSNVGVPGRTVGSQPTVGEPCQEVSVHEKGARRDRTSHNQRGENRDTVERRRCHWRSRSSIDPSVDTNISLPTPRDHPRRR